MLTKKSRGKKWREAWEKGMKRGRKKGREKVDISLPLAKTKAVSLILKTPFFLLQRT